MDRVRGQQFPETISLLENRLLWDGEGHALLQCLAPARRPTPGVPAVAAASARNRSSESVLAILSHLLEALKWNARIRIHLRDFS
jgi:hypothetical protein